VGVNISLAHPPLYPLPSREVSNKVDFFLIKELEILLVKNKRLAILRKILYGKKKK
jgi:hypothetical protein